MAKITDDAYLSAAVSIVLAMKPDISQKIAVANPTARHNKIREQIVANVKTVFMDLKASMDAPDTD